MKKFLQSLPQVLVNLCVSYTCAVLLPRPQCCNMCSSRGKP